MGDDGPARVRLAEILAALSLGIDLGFGQPMEHVLRQCLIAMRLGERVGLDEQERATVYYTALLVDVGCHTDAHEQAKWFGDDIAIKADKYVHGLHGVRSAAATLRRLGAGHTLRQRFRLGLEFAVSGHRDLDEMISHHAAMAAALARELGLSPDVQDALRGAYEQWDGRGWPGERRGEAVPTAARVAQIAEHTEVAHRVGGLAAVRALAARQRGRQFDPDLADALVADAELIFAGLDEVGAWSAVIEAEPALAVALPAERVDAVLRAVADFVDLKSPTMLGHARATAGLVAHAARAAGHPPAEVRRVEHAALVLGLGRLGVSNAIWDKPGPLGTGERERVRLHPLVTERMVRQSPGLARAGALAAQARERLDGTGYPRGLDGTTITPLGRLLGAADAYQAMREPRPHRPARTADDAARELCAEVTAGRLDRDAVSAVLAAAGHRMTRRRDGPAGLTAREVEVLRLLARGRSNRQIAAVLTISPKTVGNHVEHIYAKIGASTRAMAGLFAVQQGLLPEDG
jgi:HD-GYP domain-containing protein (c-di-GMP phosphodiesterase class II)